MDISGSAGFGSDTTKQRKILEVTASLAFAAVKNNDRIGLVLFSDRLKDIPAKRGRKHLAAMFNVMIDHVAASQKTDLSVAVKIPRNHPLTQELGRHPFGFCLALVLFAAADPAAPGTKCLRSGSPTRVSRTAGRGPHRTRRF